MAALGHKGPVHLAMEVTLAGVIQGMFLTTISPCRLSGGRRGPGTSSTLSRSGWGTVPISLLQNPALFFCRMLAHSSPGEVAPKAAPRLPSKHRAKIEASVQLASAQGLVWWDSARAGLQLCPPAGSLASGDAMTRSTEKKYGDHGPQIVVSQVAMLHSLSSQSTHIFSEPKGFIQHHVTE